MLEQVKEQSAMLSVPPSDPVWAPASETSLALLWVDQSRDCRCADGFHYT